MTERMLRPIIFLGLAVLTFLLLSWLLGHRNHPAIPEATRDSLAAYAATAKQDSLVQASLKAKAETVYVASERASQAATITAQHAAKDRLRAEYEAQLARESFSAQDSARHWQQAYNVEHRANDSLTTALIKEKAASDSARRAALFWHESSDSLDARLKRSERLTKLATKATEDANKCYVVWHIECPSRTVTGVLGLAVGLTARSALPH